jgi:glycosyltransferase involved in cell wall biosynthesis
MKNKIRSNTPSNILHVVNISFVIPYFLGEQLLYFKQKGYKEHIICSPSSELKDFADRYEFDYYAVPVVRKITLWKDIKAIVAIVRYIRQKNIGIVTGHTPKGALLSMIAARITKIPTRIYFRHGLVYETAKGNKRKLLMFIEQLTAMLSTKIVCVSPSLAQKSIEDSLNPLTKQIVLAMGTCNGIDTDRFDRKRINTSRLSSLRKDLKLEHYDFVVGFSGRLVKDKGIIELIRAFNCLHEKYPTIALLLVGMWDNRDALPVETINDIKKNVAIVTTGYVDNAIIDTYYALMNLFILPSYREGFGVSILEASSMQLPVITTRATGCVNAIIEKKTGLYVEHTPESIAKKIEVFYNNKEMCITYGKNGREFVEQNFKQEVIWREIEKLYDKPNDRLQFI